MLRLFKSKRFILLLATLLLLLLIGLSTSENSKLNWLNNIISVPLSPVQKFFSYVGEKVDDSLYFFKDIKAVREENEGLKTRVELLEKENSELKEFRDKNKELREALNLKDQFSAFTLVGANIIGKDPGNWFNVFTVDVGAKDGISNDFPVITSSKGLVGRVTQAGFTSSKVLTIIDVNSTVSARLTRTREDGLLVKGDIELKDQGLCRMEYIPADVDVAVNDLVETSGIGGIYPKGIVIGRVKDIRRTSNELRRYAVIEPIVDLKRLEEVFVMKSETSDKIDE